MKGTMIAAVAAVLSLALGSVAFAGERTVNLKILEMSCGMCPPAAWMALKGVAGVKSVSVKTTKQKDHIIEVIADETVTETMLTDTVKSVGSTAQVVSDEDE
jgi:copper chaperone CopZ